MAKQFDSTGTARAAGTPSTLLRWRGELVARRWNFRIPGAVAVGWTSKWLSWWCGWRGGTRSLRDVQSPPVTPRGGYKAAKLRNRFSVDVPRRPKSELMTRLRAASTADEIIDVLGELGRRRRGGAEELAYLADHPDPHVRDTLESILSAYRGNEARRLRERLRRSDSSASHPYGH